MPTRSLQRSKTPPYKCPGYDTKLHLILRFQSWSSRKCGVLLHCHYSQVHFNLKWLYLLGFYLWVTELLNHLTNRWLILNWIIGIRYYWDWNYLTMRKQLSSGLFTNNVFYKLFTYKSYIYIYKLINHINL